MVSFVFVVLLLVDSTSLFHLHSLEHLLPKGRDHGKGGEKTNGGVVVSSRDRDK